MRMSDGVKADLLEVAAKGIYEKAGENACLGEDRVSQETVMCQVRSTEVHISHILSERMSTRPMGWCRQGADSLSQIRILNVRGDSLPIEIPK